MDLFWNLLSSIVGQVTEVVGIMIVAPIFIAFLWVIYKIAKFFKIVKEEEFLSCIKNKTENETHNSFLVVIIFILLLGLFWYLLAQLLIFIGNPF